MSFLCKVFKNKPYLNYSVCYSISSYYHSSKGIYGYHPKKVEKKSFENDIQNNIYKNAHIVQLVNAFRSRGHLLASIDPLNLCPSNNIDALEINLQHYENDNSTIETYGIVNIGQKSCKINEIIPFLKKVYCGTISAEFMHLSDPIEREWFSNKWEEINGQSNNLSVNDQKELADHLLKSELFDNFVAKKFATVKRYGGEGCESMITFFAEAFRLACLNHSISDVIIGMPHRGRLNLMTGLLNYPPVIMFQKMLGKPEFDLALSNGATGDVLSHLFNSIDLKYNERSLHVSLLPNPSHLEAISPVVCGKSRGKAMTHSIGPYSSESSAVMPILSIQVHGDAAFTGQGVIMETLSMSNVPHFSVDGSIHLIVNNQIGFTTPGNTRGRSSLYCSDIMKSIEAPCIHVNGDYPEDVIKATRIALEYRQTFSKDIAIDLVCYRQWGHNEMDDPTFTNPIIYKAIHSREKTIPQKYSDQILTKNEKELISKEYNLYLNQEFQNATNYKPQNTNLKGVWNNMSYASNHSKTYWDTGVDSQILMYIGDKSVQIPENFKLHSNLNKVLLNDRANRVKEGLRLDWATVETLAFGSLLYNGFNVRISGQDVGRGTFSQRHVMVVDQETDEIHIPLNHMDLNQKAFIEVVNSILSEEAVLGFEYGMSIESPNNLIIWEAQFGDFFNGGQIIFDAFIASGETKWLLQSGLTILLPHGYDGAGPEHSSCRIERFLQMSDSKETGIDSDNINWTVSNPSTPAQYFHLLRRQMIRNYRKPLIVASPKILLRHPKCVSSINELESPSYFKSVLSDPTNPLPSDVKKILFCSGKHYYTLSNIRDEKNIKNVAIIRIEELCPFPVNEINIELMKYNNAKEFVWCQEEHENMGPWSFIRPRFINNFNCHLKYVGRGPHSAPAVGIGEIHKMENSNIIEMIFDKKK